MAEVVALGLDLGSTRFKTGGLEADTGRLVAIDTEPAPELCGSGLAREGDPAAYRAAADRLLRRAAGRCAAGTPLGIASQRSTFVVWDRTDGAPVTPLISWQDRRAAAWCSDHRALEPELFRRTGLALSAHYAGPKLAALRSQDAAFAAALRGGRLRFGTLECYLIWHWSAGAVHETDPTMAARTAMFDLSQGDWSQPLLDRFGVPRELLPHVRRGTRTVADAHGLSIRATMADQAASAAALLPAEADDALVNLGTGAFVLRPGGTGARRPGYLTGPFDVRDGIVRCAVEGAINGAGAAVDRFGAGPTPVPDSDPSPDAFCLPDRGAGSPYWLPALGPSWSQAARDANADARRRIALEGLIFRVRQVLEGLAPSPPRRVLIAGGLAREPFAGAGIAALLERPVELLRTRESGLLGAARIAAGLAPFADPEVVRITPGDAGRYLPRKYPRWLEWVETQARAAQTSSAS